jgi:hypothetical protein
MRKAIREISQHQQVAFSLIGTPFRIGIWRRATLFRFGDLIDNCPQILPLFLVPQLLSYSRSRQWTHLPQQQPRA